MLLHVSDLLRYAPRISLQQSCQFFGFQNFAAQAFLLKPKSRDTQSIYRRLLGHGLMT